MGNNVRLSEKPTYKKNVIVHSQKRAKERYDLWITTDVYSMSRLIRSEMDKSHPDPKHVVILYRETKLSCKFHLLVNWRNKHFWVVWNGDLNAIQTFLSIERLQEKVHKFTNSVIAYLGRLGLINTQPAFVIDVIRVRPNNVVDKQPS
jgi:hypothetical protein